MRDGERTAAGDYQGEPEKDLSKVLVQRAINGIKRAARKRKVQIGPSNVGPSNIAESLMEHADQRRSGREWSSVAHRAGRGRHAIVRKLAASIPGVVTGKGLIEPWLTRMNSPARRRE